MRLLLLLMLLLTPLNAEENLCAEIGENQFCYMGGSVGIVPSGDMRDPVVNLQEGEFASIDAIKQMMLSPYNAEFNTYAIAIMNVRVEADNTLTMIPFGDTILENLSTQTIGFITQDIEIGREGAIIRAEPNTESAAIGALTWGDSTRALARTPDATWIYVQEGGWIFALSASDLMGLDQLQINDDPQPPFYAPMQSFNLTTGINDSPADGIPESGLLIQTQTESIVAFRDEELRFDGTVHLQSAEGGLIISVLEGQATYAGRELNTAEATFLDFETGRASLAVPYQYADIQHAPLDLLPREVELPFSTGDLLIPFTPGTGYLTSMLPTDPCVVAWTVSVNLRSGPGTEYPVQEAILGNLSARVASRAIGSDGRIWWRIADSIWLLADNTVFGGDCATLPYMEITQNDE